MWHAIFWFIIGFTVCGITVFVGAILADVHQTKTTRLMTYDPEAER